MSKTYPLNTIKTVGVTSDTVLQDREALNSKRQSVILTNTSIGGQVITLAIGEPAVSKEGIVLYPGGSWSRSPNEKPPQFRIEAISDIAGASLSIYEETE